MSSTDDSLGATGTARRGMLKAGAALAAAGVVAGTPLRASAKDAGKGPLPKVPFTTKAYGVASAGSKFQPMQVTRYAPGPKDVVIDVLYSGICHSDVHAARGDWGTTIPTSYPCVPGHEIVGRVRAVGAGVTKFKVGDIGGVGCMVNSCGECEFCLADREQNCTKGTTFTYNSPDKEHGGHTYGGYSKTMVVPEHFVIRIPPGADLAATAPLLCAGVTTFSPMEHWKLTPGQKVGIVGLGGLGHMAVKLAVARGADVTVFSTTPGKIADARRLGARDAVLSTDAAAMKRHAGQFDLLISTVPEAYDMQPFINLLKVDATMVNVGALAILKGVDGIPLVFGRRTLAGSMIGGIAETQKVIDYCAARGITADIEKITPDKIDDAFDRVIGKDIRYRFVIDFTA